ncbi:hypothetical protein KM043_004607 [Ampulex compressa]|nr:hypothetical protein KM043_004607 [Ampulex compressa]
MLQCGEEYRSSAKSDDISNRGSRSNTPKVGNVFEASNTAIVSTCARLTQKFYPDLGRLSSEKVSFSVAETIEESLIPRQEFTCEIKSVLANNLFQPRNHLIPIEIRAVLSETLSRMQQHSSENPSGIADPRATGHLKYHSSWTSPMHTQARAPYNNRQSDAGRLARAEKAARSEADDT